MLGSPVEISKRFSNHQGVESAVTFLFAAALARERLSVTSVARLVRFTLLWRQEELVLLLVEVTKLVVRMLEFELGYFYCPAKN